MYTSHLAACLMYYISKIQFMKGNPTIFSTLFVLNNDWVFMYINCLYFSVVTIVTVGYGDYSPKENQVEQCYVICLILVGFSD